MANINNMSPRTGRIIRDDNTIVNEANGINEDGSRNVFASATGAVAVTPHDTNDLAGGATKGLYVGGSGNVVVIMANDDEVTFTGLSAGVVHPFSVKRVKATGTTATSIVAVY